MIHTLNRVKRIVNLVGLGATEPLWAILEDDTYVVFKTYNNLQGNKSLVNEFIGYKIASLLQMPIPVAGLAYLDSDTEIPEAVLSSFEFPREKFHGLGFYSTAVEKGLPLTAASVLTKISNYDDIPRIVAFDILLGNYDRNTGNLIIQMKKSLKKMYIIDHSHLFHLGCMWDSYQLDRISSEPIDIEHLKAFDNYHYSIFSECYSYSRDNFEEIYEDFKFNITDVAIQDIIKEIPNVWSVSEAEKLSIANFLKTRRDNLLNSLIDFMEGGTGNV